MYVFDEITLSRFRVYIRPSETPLPPSLTHQSESSASQHSTLSHLSDSSPVALRVPPFPYLDHLTTQYDRPNRIRLRPTLTRLRDPH